MKANSALRAHIERTIGSAGFSDFFLSLIRAENAISARVDQMMPTGMTTARWQVLKVVGRLGGAAPVPVIARELSLTRQAVQKQVDLLLAQKLVELRDNPHHRRSALIALTRSGHHAMSEAAKRWMWVARALGDDLDPKEIERMRELFERISERLVREVEAHDEARAVRSGRSS